MHSNQAMLGPTHIEMHDTLQFKSLAFSYLARYLVLHYLHILPPISIKQLHGDVDSPTSVMVPCTGSE